MAKPALGDDSASRDLSGDSSDEPSGDEVRPRKLTARERAGGQPLDEESRIIEHLATQPPDTRTRVYRVDDSTKTWQEHGILSPEEVNQEWIARRWGGGTYHIRVIDIAKGPHRYSATSTWTIPGPYKGVGAGVYGLGEPAPAAGAASAPAGNGRVDIREVVDGAMATRFMDLLARDHRPSLDLGGIAAIITAFGTLALPVLTKMMNRGPDPMLEEIRRQLEAMRNRPGPAVGAMDEMMQGIEKVLKLREALEGAGGSDRKIPFEERLLNVLPDVLSAMGGRRAAPAGEEPPPMTEIPGTPAGAAPATTPAVPGTPPWSAMLLNFRDQLFYLAQSGWEPDYCAELVQRTMPTEYVGLLTEFLRRDDAQAILLQTIPELGTYEKWLPAFLEECRAMIVGGDESEEEDKK